MTDKTFPLTYDVIETLFKNGVCLSYNPTEPMTAWRYAKELETEYKKQHKVKRCRIVSKTAKLWQRSYHPRFHYFSDGSLIFSRYLGEKTAPAELERIKTMLKIRGYKISKIYAPQEQIDVFSYDKMLRYVSEQACMRYSYTEDLEVVAFPNKEEFIKECFYEGNVLLTASKDENVKAECRDYLALFADGRFFVSDIYQSVKTSNFGRITLFEYSNEEYLRMEQEYVPQDYIEAIYAKAVEYDWYESPEAAKEKQRLSFNELMKMQKYIDKLFVNRKCVSLLNPMIQNIFLTPEVDKYALFSDGLLIIGQSRTRFGEDSLFIEQMHTAYPGYEFKIEQVPDYYLPEIYRRLPEFQKSAEQTYIEMLKQKARKIKKMVEISHHEALDVVAQMAGWQNWKALKVEDETHARHLIWQNMSDRRMYVTRNPENPLEEEYKYWQMRQKHSK